MSQSRREGRNKMTMPCFYKREKCLKEAITNFQAITCENSGRVVPQAPQVVDEGPVI